MVRERSTVARPPYRIPTLEEIRAVPANGYRLVSTFSGAGGTCLGFRMAGFRVAWASEFVPIARETYAANADPETVIDGRDIREVSGASILEATGLLEVDVLEGSPPCASYSTSGKRSRGWGESRLYSGGIAQRTDDLFGEYLRLVAELRPKVVVAENVEGIVTGAAQGIYLDILRELRRLGYRADSRLLDGQWLGVPQSRRRLIFLAVREDLGRDPIWPDPLPYRYGLGEAIADVEDRAGATFVDCAIYPAWLRLRPGRKSTRYYNLVRPDPLLPVPTISAQGGNRGAASVTHPTEPRKFSIGELRRLSGFPDDFRLVGTYREQYERLGRAVPPPMMAAIARGVAEILGGTR